MFNDRIFSKSDSRFYINMMFVMWFTKSKFYHMNNIEIVDNIYAI